MSQALKFIPIPKKPKLAPLTAAQRAYLDRVIRVDQAGELGANLIYNGQYTALSHIPHVKPIIKHMWEQEIVHHDTFNMLQTQLRVRPSLLTPAWKVGAFGMGLVTGLMNKEAAMACTEAVETVIGAHYNQQLRVLASQFPADSEEVEYLKSTIKLFRDQELEHLDTAVQNDSKDARPYWLLTEGIKTICKTAVYVAERV